MIVIFMEVRICSRRAVITIQKENGMKSGWFLLGLALLVAGCSRNETGEEAGVFIKSYNEQFQQLYYESAKASWMANTDISPEHDSLSVLADKAYAQYIGSREIIEKTRSFLKQKDDLDHLQILQLQKILLAAAHRPGTIPETVDSLINAETQQNSMLYGFDFTIADRSGKPKNLTTNEIDQILLESDDLAERLAAWESSKEVGTILRDGLVSLQHLRNRAAREMGFSSFFDLEVSDYGMSVQEMMDLMDRLVEETEPLYRELHTYVRYTLAEKYGKPVPDLLPAHWLPNRWGQNWPGIVEAVDLDQGFSEKSPEWIVEQAEEFYVSLGFEDLNQGFWDRSDLYPATVESKRKKNNHASAWHLDLDQDYRSLMSVEANDRWFRTTHHELGHIYYFMEYTNPQVPLLLREGANRGYHEGIGDLMAIAAGQKPYFQQLGLLSEDVEVDEIRWLLNDALSNSSIVFIPFSAGTMTHFEHDLYEANLPANEFNERWWKYVGEFQGIAPPALRGEEYCDASSKTHINNDPAQYYDYAVSCVLKFQLHDHIARNILKQNPHACNYYDSEEVGTFLRSIMRPGASRDWRVVLKESTGEDLSARAMLEYYSPLLEFLRDANKGRKHTI